MPPGALHAAVVAVLDAVRSEPCDPMRCGTEGKQVLKLWRALEYPPLERFQADAELVARAFRACPDPLFRRDVRAEGWPTGVDRRHSVSTLCVQARWAERLSRARQWQGRGRSGGPTRADLRPRHDPFAELRELQRGKSDDRYRRAAERRARRARGVGYLDVEPGPRG